MWKSESNEIVSNKINKIINTECGYDKEREREKVEIRKHSTKMSLVNNE